jgi:hypothetical protein
MVRKVCTLVFVLLLALSGLLLAFSNLTFNNITVI